VHQCEVGDERRARCAVGVCHQKWCVDVMNSEARLCPAQFSVEALEVLGGDRLDSRG
jgi:hypothetical protein